MTDESGRPGTCRSKVGCEAIDEPCTKRTVPMDLAGSPAHFSKRNNFTPPSLVVQCSSPLIAAVGLLISFMAYPSGSVDRWNVVGLDDLRPLFDLRIHESLEFGLRHHDRRCAGLFP